MSIISNTLTRVYSVCVERYGAPEIVNSDQGCQYTSKDWVTTLKENEIKISMDGRGRATDNIWIERFWRTLKRGYIYLHPAEDGLELHRGVKGYIDYYNFGRSHTELGGAPPSSVYLTGRSKPPVKERK